MIAFEINEASSESYASQINSEAHRLEHRIEHLHNVGVKVFGLSPWAAAVVSGPDGTDEGRLVGMLEDFQARLKSVNTYKLPKRLQSANTGD